ncbi:hypothetical protein [Iningainema tapete]|uniref:Uncharacterized protein n=1 Tax=Iningainema tapete BLCC-T55 TaxID=2748662 RepID=A0A8J7BWM2_9CYAN|nr:hypothetical protein [Iningainema tapete]MBD2771183.1 hypothetical protein [Iningainema tapete BLCC-T55]
MPISIGYRIANLAALTAIAQENRPDGYTRLVQSDADGLPAWYTFIASSTATADGNSVVTPDDGIGRWIKSSGTGGGVAFGGGNLCTSGQCAIGGKAFQFYAPQQSLQLTVVPGFDISISTGSTSIQLHRWNQAPNTSLIGREFVQALPNTGGKIAVTIDSTYRWISFFAKNPAKSGQYDGVCFTMSGNVVTLLGYS